MRGGADPSSPEMSRPGTAVPEPSCFSGTEDPDERPAQEIPGMMQMVEVGYPLPSVEVTPSALQRIP